MLMYRSIKDHYKKDGKSLALLYLGRKFTYDELFFNIEDAAARLAPYVTAGDVATVCMPNTPECVFCFYALNRLGAIVHMAHPLAPLNQIKKQMKAAESKLLITLSVNLEKYAPMASELPIISIHPARSLGRIKRALFDIKFKPYNGDRAGIVDYDELKRGELPPEPNRDGSSVGVYLHSGGSGGEPKIIKISDDAVNSLGNRGLEALDLCDARGRYMLAVVPMSHGYGLTMGVHTTLTYGATSVLMPKFDAKSAVKLIKKGKLNFLVGVPSLYRALLAQKGFDGKALKNIYVGFIGGDSSPQSLLDEFNDRMKSVGATGRLFEGYGLTETTNVCVVNNYKYNRMGSLGRPLSGLTAKIIEPNGDKVLGVMERGEIAIAGDTLMLGYLNGVDHDVFVDIGGVRYVRTGDFGYMDGDGYLYFVQRLKRIIKISGISVYPRDIEASVMEMRGVIGACAVEYSVGGKPKIALYYTGERLSDDEIRKKIAQDLTHYAMPTIVEHIDKIPMTPMMKADTLSLSARAQNAAKEM